MPPTRIVVGYAAAPEGRAALRRAIVEAGLRDCELIVLSMDAEGDLNGLTAELAESGVRHQLRTASDDVDPADDLIATADEVDAAFIVIGLRRRSPVGKLLLGSNAQRVLLDAACPVLAVKA